MKKKGAAMNNDIQHDEMFVDSPLKQYSAIFKDRHLEHATQFIDNLIEESKVNIEENRQTIKVIKKLEHEKNTIVKVISTLNGQRVLCILLLIISIIGMLLSISQMVSGVQTVYYPIIIVTGLVLIVLSIFLITKKINPKLKVAKQNKLDLEQKIKTEIDIAYQQLSPLNALFKEGISEQLFQKTLPLIKLDPMFNSKRLDYMINKFGHPTDDDINRSALYIKSGEIKGNPFYIVDDLVHELGTKSYSGSITIRWTTTSRVNGKTVVNHHSQVLTATVNKPCPYYYEEPYLVYANDAAPDLIFSRQDSDAEHMNQKQIDRKVHRDIKKLGKKAEKSIAKGQNYTVLGNSEFEVLFGATNRNHEVQFRLLFTPLAQRQLLELMKEKEIGYGDDFDFVKDRKLNYVYPEHLEKFKLDVSPSYYHHYDIDELKKKFITYQNEYFKQVYFTFAPVLAIPLYQQQVPQEYIYKDLYDSYVSFYEHEKVVNMMNQNEFKHPLSVTRNILKTSTLSSKNNCDTIKVTAYGYRTEPRIDYVQKMGGDGRMHTIPVHWTEYLPVEQESKVEINVIEEEKEETYQDKFRKLFEGIKEGKGSQTTLLGIQGFIALVIKDDVSNKK